MKTLLILVGICIGIYVATKISLKSEVEAVEKISHKSLDQIRIILRGSK